MTTPFERLLVILDYDGTITVDDCNEVVLQQAVGDAWRASDEAMQRGEISPNEAFRRQIGLLRVPRRELLAMTVAAARLRPGFRDFLAGLLDGGARVVIVSDGLREAIAAVWERERLPAVEIHASELHGDPHAGYDVGFNTLALACERCEHCKAHVLRHVRNGEARIAVFGDGDGDLCLARHADIVFARRRLAGLCAREGIAFHPFDGYAGALDALQALAASR
ncbi:MAG: HAD-IB family phosphatase [Actinobacteria bacterium]|nr:HAD-IB family phosphatase [Actinomycetota bacterium]